MHAQESIIKKSLTKLNHDVQGAKSVGSWIICKNNRRKNEFILRRQITWDELSKRTFQNFPSKLLKLIRENRSEIEQFANRLNHVDSVKDSALNKVKIINSFIPPEILEAFENKLKIEIPTKHVARYTYRYAKELFIDFFTSFEENPVIWHRDYQPKWAIFLKEKDYSVSMLKKIVNSSNRFMKFLHEKRPDEVPLLIFKPISNSVIKTIRAEKESKGQGAKKRKYIDDNDMEKIKSKLPDGIREVFLLGCYYGLRRSEILGLFGNLFALKRDYLLVDRQAEKVLENKMVTRPTKNRLSRKVNHWFCSAGKCYSLIENLPLMNADALTRKFDLIIKELYKNKEIKHKYVLHDTRHTFISNAVTKYNINDVCRAAGHHNISVTNEYLKDVRNLGDEIYTPEVA